MESAYKHLPTGRSFREMVSPQIVEIVDDIQGGIRYQTAEQEQRRIPPLVKFQRKEMEREENANERKRDHQYDRKRLAERFEQDGTDHVDNEEHQGHEPQVRVVVTAPTEPPRPTGYGYGIPIGQGGLDTGHHTLLYDIVQLVGAYKPVVHVEQVLLVVAHDGVAHPHFSDRRNVVEAHHRRVVHLQRGMHHRPYRGGVIAIGLHRHGREHTGGRFDR